MTAGLLSLLIASALGGLAGPDDRSARIDVTAGEAYTVQAVAVSGHAASGTYTLVVERVGAAGRSRSQQGGAFEMAAGERTLSTSSVNVAAGDSLRTELTITWADGVVTEDRVHVTGQP